jgi:hypothetical protein
MHQGQAWMDVWPGIDFLQGTLSLLFGSPEVAILILGIAVNAVAVLVVNQLFRLYDASRSSRLAAVLVTAAFFLPPLGGWTTDHITYLVALLPAFSYVHSRCRVTLSLAFLAALSLAFGLTLKLNNFAPGYLFSLGWISFTSLLLHVRSCPRTTVLLSRHLRLLIIFLISLVFWSLLLSWQIRLPGGLYPSIYSAYKLVLQSTASGQFSAERLSRIPLQMDLVDAFRSMQLGVLVFVPLVLLFWASLTRSLLKILSVTSTRPQIQRHAVALLLMGATAIICFGLGRGLSHRLFLLPAGILLSCSDLPTPLTGRCAFNFAFLSYLFAIWISLAWVQRGLEWNRPYNYRALLPEQSTVGRLCVGNKQDSVQVDPFRSRSSSTLYFEPLPEARETDLRCWNRTQANTEIAGFVNVQEPANTLGFIYPNHQAGQGDYFEKWDWRKATPSYRSMWSRKQADFINQHRVPYFVERLLVMPEEHAVPGYSANIIPRQEQRKILVANTDAVPIGQLGEITLWRTRWAQ